MQEFDKVRFSDTFSKNARKITTILQPFGLPNSNPTIGVMIFSKQELFSGSAGLAFRILFA